MIRSAISAFFVCCLCFAILQVPSSPQYAPLPAAAAKAPSYAPLPTGNCPGGVCPVPAKPVAVASVQQVSMPVSAAPAPMSTVVYPVVSQPVVRYVQTVSRPVYRPVYQATPVRTVLQRVAPLRRVGNLLRGVRNTVSFRRCR